MREADCGTQSLRDTLQVLAGDGGVLEDHARPHLAELGGDLRFESVELGEDVRIVYFLVASFDVDDLAGTERVIGGVGLIDSLLQQGGRVGHDDDCRVRFPVEYGLPYE